MIPPAPAAQRVRRMVKPSSLARSGARGAHHLAARTTANATTVTQAPGVVQLEYLNGAVTAWFVSTATIPKGSSIAITVAHDNGTEIDCDPLNLTADVAPGSSMKIITSAALFNAGYLNPQTPVECPKAYTVQGITFHNDKNETEPAGTPFITDFAQSCNNAFTSQWQHLSGALAGTAKEYFGLNQKWNIGITGLSASYFHAPADASGAELAQEAFGQGALQASPLAMASVAATVDTGTFKQPILVPGTAQVSATPLSSSTQNNLKTLMRAVVTNGTLAGVITNTSAYGKTGTAQVQGKQDNSWTIAFRGDYAIAALAVGGGFGASTAGPEVNQVLNTLP